MSKIFKHLKKGYEEMIAYKKGKQTLCCENIEFSEPSMKRVSKDSKKDRDSQKISAKTLK